jgi:hypothetical protein
MSELKLRPPKKANEFVSRERNESRFLVVPAPSCAHRDSLGMTPGTSPREAGPTFVTPEEGFLGANEAPQNDSAVESTRGDRAREGTIRTLRVHREGRGTRKFQTTGKDGTLRVRCNRPTADPFPV